MGWRDICTRPNYWSTEAFMEDMKAMKEKVAALPKPEFDAVVLLRKDWEKVEKDFQAGGGHNFDLFSVPLYLVENEVERVEKVVALMLEGRRVATLPKVDGEVTP
jgi:hypothetical protein